MPDATLSSSMDLHALLSSRLEGLRRNSDGTYQARCPICALSGGDSGKQHLRIWPSQAFRCVKDDSKEHNKAVRAVIYDSADPETLAELSLQVIDPEPKLEVEKVYPEEMLTKLVPDYRYWAGRGISEEVLRRMGGGLAPADERSKLSGRFIHPLRNKGDKLIGFAGRLVSEASFGPKWKILGKKTKFVYPHYSILSKELDSKKEIILVEGIGCVLSLASAGIWNTFCLFGLNVSSVLLGLVVSKNLKRVVIATNNEASGIGNTAAAKIRAQLIVFLGEEKVIVHLPDKKDFAEMSSEAIQQWYNTSQVAPDEVKAFKAEVEAL